MFLYSYSVLFVSLVVPICFCVSFDENGDLSVIALDKPKMPKMYYIFLNETVCRIWERKPSFTHFVYDKEMCAVKTDPYQVIVPPFKVADFPEDYFSSKNNKNYSVCVLQKTEGTETYCFINFVTEEQSKQNDTGIVSERKLIEQGDPNLTLYLIIGAAVAIIAILQSICIYIIYKRRDSRTPRRLNQLTVRSQKDDKARYSAGPGQSKKKEEKISNDNNIYESLENLAASSAKGARNQRWGSRPQMPLPHELGNQDLSNHMKSSQNVHSLPHRRHLESASIDRLLHSPHQPQSSTTPRISKKPCSTAPKPIVDELNKMFQRKHAPLLSSTSSIPLQTLRSQGHHPNIDTTASLSRPVHRPPPMLQSFSSREADSSDEEWKYELLPPIHKYLH